MGQDAKDQTATVIANAEATVAEAKKNKRETCADGQAAEGYIERVRGFHQEKIKQAEQALKAKKRLHDATSGKITKIGQKVTANQEKLTAVNARRDQEQLSPQSL